MFAPVVVVAFIVLRILYESIMIGKDFKMKKTVLWLIIIAALVCAVLLAACNTQIIDTTWKFNRAVISLPNGEVIDGAVESWRDYEDGDQLQVKIDGVTYLTHAANVVLIYEP